MADYIYYAVIRAIELEELIHPILCLVNCKQITYIDADEFSGQGARHAAMQVSLHITRQLRWSAAGRVLPSPN
jgi:hypothetical protein